MFLRLYYIGCLVFPFWLCVLFLFFLCVLRWHSNRSVYC